MPPHRKFRFLHFSEGLIKPSPTYGHSQPPERVSCSTVSFTRKGQALVGCQYRAGADR